MPDSSFRHVIIPRYRVLFEEPEQALFIALKTFSIFDCQFGLVVAFNNIFLVELFYGLLELVKVSLL